MGRRGSLSAELDGHPRQREGSLDASVVAAVAVCHGSQAGKEEVQVGDST